MELFDDPAPGPAGANAPEFSVSELSGAVKRVIEGEFALVRVRGEVGRVSRPGSGHLYLDLKDDRACIAGVVWKGTAARLTTRPEEGMEVIATGRMTTFPGQSKYQLVIEDIRPAGLGALMAMLEKRRAALAAEGLFDAARKRPLPFLPGVIGVVTSPSGAVIRDILHRLADRFPRHVLVWPVAVQGQACAAQVARAIAGFNRLAPGGPVPRPDVIIVARGGGSVEDLWGFNEEIVVRAAAASAIPLISAVGHETDTTLIDHVSDRRAPTPTAAAEMAVPVRADLEAQTASLGARLARAARDATLRRRQRLDDLARALPAPAALLARPRDRLRLAARGLPAALRSEVQIKRARFSRAAAGVRGPSLVRQVDAGRGRLDAAGERLGLAAARLTSTRREALAARAGRLAPAFRRALAEHGRRHAEGRERLAGGAARLAAAHLRLRAMLSERLAAADRVRVALGYRQTLARGYAVVWTGEGADAAVVTSAAAAEAARDLRIEFADGLMRPGAAADRTREPREPPSQGRLF